MREWFVVIAPFAVILYFSAYPDEFELACNWFNFATRWVLRVL